MQVRDFKSPEYREPPRARDFRRQAREALKGNWWRMALVMLVFLLLAGTQTDRSFRVESNFSVPQYTSLNLHSSVGLGPYTRTDTYPINLSWSDYNELTLPEQFAYSFQAIWLSLPAGVRTFLIGASLVSLALALIAPALRLGLYEAMSALYRRERPRVSALFSQFHLFGRALWLGIIIWFFIILWSLLLVIPGIVAGYRYSMAYYILWRNPDMRAIDALRESKRYMQGNKGRLFCLHLSYIGWQLLMLVPMVALPILMWNPYGRAALFFPILLAVLWLYVLAANMFLNSYMEVGEFAFFRDLEAGHRALEPEPDVESV